jgi:hypothetical protein
MQLHAVHKKKPTMKFVGRKRETMKGESQKNHPESQQRCRDDLGAGEDGLSILSQEPLLIHLFQISFHESGGSPAHSLFLRTFIRHSFGMSNAFNGHAMAQHWKLPEGTHTRKKKKRWQRRSRELVNSKSKRVSP